MEDEEVGQLWRELTEGLHDQSLTNGLRRNRWRDLISKLVHERAKAYQFNDSGNCSRTGEDALRVALCDFGIDMASWEKYGPQLEA